MFRQRRQLDKSRETAPPNIPQEFLQWLGSEESSFGKNTFSLLPGPPIPSWKSSCRNFPVGGFIIEAMEIVCPLKNPPKNQHLCRL